MPMESLQPLAEAVQGLSLGNAVTGACVCSLRGQGQAPHSLGLFWATLGLRDKGLPHTCCNNDRKPAELLPSEKIMDRWVRVRCFDYYLLPEYAEFYLCYCRKINIILPKNTNKKVTWGHYIKSLYKLKEEHWYIVFLFVVCCFLWCL